MNQPVGNRYFDRLMPLGPNSRSDGSIVESEIVSVIAYSVRAHNYGRSDPVRRLLLLF